MQCPESVCAKTEPLRARLGGLHRASLKRRPEEGSSCGEAQRPRPPGTIPKCLMALGDLTGCRVESLLSSWPLAGDGNLLWGRRIFLSLS